MKTGKKILYCKNNKLKKAIIVKEHADDAPNVYYTIKLVEEQREINTVGKYLMTYSEFRKKYKKTD